MRFSDDHADHLENAPSCFVRSYQESTGGSIGCLLQLAKSLADLIPTYPRLTNDLTSICQVASDIMTDSLNRRIPDNTSTASQKLEDGFALYELVCNILDAMIEKTPTQLFADNVIKGISALSDMLKAALRGGLPIASRQLQEHLAGFPAVSRDYAVEAIALKRRVTTYMKLIRSSQM